MTTQYHTDGIVGAVCAHSDRMPFRLFWLGPGSDAIYIGRCMEEPTGLITSAPGVGYASTAKTFRETVERFIEDNT